MENSRRYYIHRCLKKLKGVSVNARKRTVYIPYNMELNSKMKELQQCQYSIQTQID